jgi:hypothetical protein
MSFSDYTQLENRGFASVIASATAAVGLTGSYPTNSATGRQGIPNYAIISVDSNSARWRDDGTAPTATVGMPLPINTNLLYDGELGKFQIISNAVSANVNISFYNAY